MTDDDRVFKALADPTRRFLLDALFERDGRTLTELESALAMTRFGVMKHLRLLEEAGLVVTRRSGREKHHFLNPVPIRLVHDRWIDKYTEPWTEALSDLKHRLESQMEQDSQMEKESQMEKVFEIYIRTTPERLWEAIVDRRTRSVYTFGAEVVSNWSPGSGYELVAPEADMVIASGENVEVDPPRRLVQTFTARWSDEVTAQGTSRVTWEIEPVEDSCRLTVIHDQLPTDANPELYGGWPMILSGLKTWLETGEQLTTPGSLRWAATA